MDSNKKQLNIITRMRNQYYALTFDDNNKIPVINQKKSEFENEKNNNELNVNVNPNRNILNNIINNNKNDKNIEVIINKSEYKDNLPKINFRKIKKNNNSYPKNSRYNSIFNNNDKPINKNISINERFYKPYSLKEYKSMMNNYKKDKFGGLGINMNNDWTKRQKIYNKVKNFENSVYHNFNKRMNEYNIRKIESPQKSEFKRIKQQIMNSKRFIAQKYGKGLMLNKIREKKRKEEEEFKIFLRYKNYKKNRNKKNILNGYDNVIDNKKENYQMKILQLKSSLI